MFAHGGFTMCGMCRLCGECTPCAVRSRWAARDRDTTATVTLNTSGAGSVLMGSDEPSAIRSVAVTRADVVTALESNLRSDGRTVLRVTPPFSGRMRARLHEMGTGE